jgi:hypothetical protein
MAIADQMTTALRYILFRFFLIVDLSYQSAICLKGTEKILSSMMGAAEQ